MDALKNCAPNPTEAALLLGVDDKWNISGTIVWNIDNIFIHLYMIMQYI